MNIPTGDVIIVFSALGYEEQEQLVNLSEGETKTLDIRMGASSMLLDAVVKTGSKFEKN